MQSVPTDAVVSESNFQRAFSFQIFYNQDVGGKLPQELCFYRERQGRVGPSGQSLPVKPEVASTHGKVESGGKVEVNLLLSVSSLLSRLLPWEVCPGGSQALGCLQQSVRKLGAVPFPDWLLTVVRQAVLLLAHNDTQDPYT